MSLAPTAYTTPPLLANNSVYAGRADGTVVRYDATTLAPLASFSADSGIVVGPILGPGGQVLVGTQSGTFYSLSIGLTLRWQKVLGAGALTGQPAFTANGLYVANGDWLEIYDPGQRGADQPPVPGNRGRRRNRGGGLRPPGVRPDQPGADRGGRRRLAAADRPADLESQF